ncbi:MAG: hypothetical protein Q8N23_01215 [Archangium sp.]|nr:hypothetical protein [Archangium sp.]MDP3570103.1 hypothetical protein [Archangium sp.]
MAAPPILLVADDLSVIASVKRVLAREGYECVLATSAADAVIAFGHLLPGLIILQPSVESDRGGVLLEELQIHPDAQLLRVLLLGETIPGFAWPVIPLPLDPDFFATALDENVRTTDEAGSWSVLETAPAETPPMPVEPSNQPADDWRATSPHEVDQDAPQEDMPEPQAIVADPTPPNLPDALEEKLFGDLAADVEASAMQSVESSLPQPQDDDEELTRLEDEVRAEAHRRRQSREARAVTVKPAAEPPPPMEMPSSQPEGDESFEGMSEEPVPPPSRATEVLSRAEQMVLDGRAKSEARQRAEETDAKALREEAASNSRRAEQAEEAARTEREARSSSEEQLFTLRDELDRLKADSANERELTRVRHENELETIKADVEATRQVSEALLKTEARKLADAERALEEEKEQRAALAAELEDTSAQVATARAEANKRAALEEKLEEAHARIAALEAEVSGLQMVASTAAEEHQKRQILETQLAERDALIAELTQKVEAAGPLADDAELARMQLEENNAQLQASNAQLQESGAQLKLTEQHLAEARQARDDAQTEMLAIEDARDTLHAQLTEATSRLEALQADVTSASGLLEDTAKERDTLRARIATLEPQQALAEKLAAELEEETHRRTGLEAELEDAKRALDSTRTRAESMEATAVMASEKVKSLEAREVMSLALPGKRSVGVARHGSVELEGLARVVCQLVIGNAEARLELGVSGGTRNLWFKRGQIIAAESSLEQEGLISRARRDGLIDARQDSELRMLKGATPREQLEALKARGFIRDIESVPLVQRYTEQVALDAFTEEKTLYRVVEEVPRPEVLLATVPRPTLPMLAESLRRAVAPDIMLERLGGGEAVPVATDSELDLRALGFSERERKMLTWVDGEATIEDLSLASGLKPDLAFRALLVAQLLGIIEVRPGQKKKTEPGSGQLDLHRLEAKYDEVQDADYFTILGLSRAAGTEDVRRAFQRLTQEFDPLRFSGHPDPSIQQRAQVVANLLEEAARALEDDRRRVEYARHLLD